MSEPSPVPDSEVRDEVEAIVADGQDVRQKVKELVTKSSRAAQQTGEGLLGLARTVMEGATDALNRGITSVPSDSTLRQVIDGIGDGLSQVAMSAKMSMEEASSQGKQFASEDLHKIKNDLTDLTTFYVNTVSDAISKTKSEAAAGIGNLLEHAELARERMLPAVKSAVDLVVQDPKGVGKDSIRAGIAASQYAVGSLFNTMGQFLQDAGKKLTSTEKPS